MEINEESQKDNPNVVKVVGVKIGPKRLKALYFTRAKAPHGEGTLYHHIGLYGYRRKVLESFSDLPVPRLKTGSILNSCERLKLACGLMLPWSRIFR